MRPDLRLRASGPTTSPHPALRAAVLLALCVGLGLVLSGCDPDPTGARVSGLAPSVAQQDKLLTIVGSDFGDFVEGRSAVVVAGTCAQIGAWSDESIAILVPTAIGTGARTLSVFTADGETARVDLEIVGRDLPLKPRPACAYAAGPSADPDASSPDTTDPDTTTPDGTAPDTTVPDGTISPDIDIPDVPVPECPAATGPGACTGERDCEIVSFDQERLDQIVFECTANCIAEGDIEQCLSDCVSFQAGLSSECSACFGELGLCVVESCLAECLADPLSGPCVACQDRACTPAFDACSGVPRSGAGTDAYRWVRIDDAEGRFEEPLGPEIDAVLFERFDGSISVVRAVPRFQPGDGAGNPELAIGPPDAYFDWPSLEFCTERGTAVLGLFGSIVVEMESAVSAEGILTVLELGGCEGANGNPPELYDVYIGTSPDGPWVYLGLGEGASSFMVPVP